MSLLDNMRQTLNDVAGNMVEQGKQLTAQTQLQLAVKKMQLERARRIHELGKQTFDWYRNGQLVVSGQVPADVADLCHQLEDLERELADAQRELDAIAAESVAPHVEVTDVTAASAPDQTPNYTTQTAPPYPPQYPPQPPYAAPTYAPQPPYTPPASDAQNTAHPMPGATPPNAHDPHGTTVLPDPSTPQPPYNAPYGAPPAASAPYGYNPPPQENDERKDGPADGFPGLGSRPPAP